jgi:hypothetical protein
MTADKAAHPWPPEGRWIDFRFRRGVWALARPWYMVGAKYIPLTALTWFTPIRFWFPFLTYNIKWRSYGIHGYIGWKPITLDDPLFPWRGLDIVQKWKSEGRLFVQLSWRGGINDIG